MRWSGRTLTIDRGFAFFHSLDCVIDFCEKMAFSRQQVDIFLQELLDTPALNNPLYVREMLQYPERLDARTPQELVHAISENYKKNTSYARTELHEIPDEEHLASQFFRQRVNEGVFPGRFVVHSVDSQATVKSWRTYEQIAAVTALRLASVATYGLVAGGVVGGLNPTTLNSTLDRADLMILNWYPEYQGSIIIPIEYFIQEGFKWETRGSMSVMVDGERTEGIDIIVGPDEKGLLPHILPSQFVVIIPKQLQQATEDEISRLHYKLLRPSRELDSTVQRCLVYDPYLWKNYHYFNEWLQTTPEGNEILERIIGRSLSSLQTLDERRRN